MHSICSYGVRVYIFDSWGGWDGPLLLPLLLPLRSRFSEAFPQRDRGPRRICYVLGQLLNNLTPRAKPGQLISLIIRVRTRVSVESNCNLVSGLWWLLVKDSWKGLLWQDSKRLIIRKRIQRDAGDGRGIEYLPVSTAVDKSLTVFYVRSMSYVNGAESSW